MKKVFCFTSRCWQGFPSFRRTTQNARTVVFLHSSIIIFKKQVDVLTHLYVLFKNKLYKQQQTKAVGLPNFAKA